MLSGGRRRACEAGGGCNGPCWARLQACRGISAATIGIWWASRRFRSSIGGREQALSLKSIGEALPYIVLNIISTRQLLIRRSFLWGTTPNHILV